MDKLIFISDNIEPEKRDSDLLEMILLPDTKINDVIKEIIKRKKERADKKGIEANPIFDATMEGLELD